MYNVGATVQINEEGHDKYGRDFMNPPNKLGVVIERPSFMDVSLTLDPDWTWVRWVTGVENSYEVGTLDVVEG